MSDIDDDLALHDDEFHEALIGSREARDLMKEARVARGFYPVVVPILRSVKPTGRSLKCQEFWQGLVKGGRGSKDSGRSGVVRVIIGRVIVQRLMMVLRVRRNEIWEPTHVVRGSATILTILLKSVHQTEETLFSKSHEIDIQIPDVDPFGGRSFNFGDAAASKAASLSRFPVQTMLLVVSGSLCICSWISRNRLH